MPPSLHGILLQEDGEYFFCLRETLLWRTLVGGGYMGGGKCYILILGGVI